MNKGASSSQQSKSGKRKRNQRTQRCHTVTTKQLSGGKYTPATNPPDLTAQPWYPLTLSWLNKPSSVTFTSIIDVFVRQLDPQKSGLNRVPFAQANGVPFRVQLRFLRLAVWNLSGKALSLSVYDDLEHDNTDKDQLGGWTDCGGASHFPAIGYIYPYSHQNRVHRPDETLKDTVVYITTSSSSNDSILNHLSILWRFDGGVHTLSVGPTYEEELLEGIRSISREIHASQPSTLERIVDGVQQAAAAVTVVSGSGYAQHVAPHDLDVNGLVDIVVQKLAIRGISTVAPNSSSPSEDGMSSFTSP